MNTVTAKRFFEKWHRRLRTGAFTIIEMLVAAAVFMLLTVLVLAAVNGMTRVVQTGAAESERAEKAGMVFDAMRRDLSGALLPMDPADNSGFQFLAAPSGLAAGLQNPHTIFWQAPVASDAADGDLAVVGYFIRWNTDNTAGNPQARLCRIAVDPDTMDFAANPWLTDDVLNTASAEQDDGYPGLVETGVIALWTRCVAADGEPVDPTDYEFDSRQANALPAAIDIALVVVDGRTAARIDGVPAYTDTTPEQWDENIAAFMNSLPPGVRAGARLYQTRIPLTNFRRQ